MFKIQKWNPFSISLYIAATLVTLSQALTISSVPKPIDSSGWPYKFPAKEHCSKCGLCETTLVRHVTEACAFLDEGMSKIDRIPNYSSLTTQTLEHQTHQRGRHEFESERSVNNKKRADESRFGVMTRPMLLAKGIGLEDAQWTGCVTSIALSMLECNMVDAVVCIASSSSWSDPEPILARTTGDVLRGRGVKPALAPSLKVLDKVIDDPSIRRLLFCGVGCAVQAFRSIQHLLKLEQVYVLGTNCADNSPNPTAAQNFIQRGIGIDPSQVRGYEFMADFSVHVKVMGDTYIKKPYFCLPSDLAAQSIAPSCLACFDYTNALADVVIGYMAAPLSTGGNMDTSYQTLTIRNSRGEQMIQAALDRSRLQLGPEAIGYGASHEDLTLATVTADGIVQNMIGEDKPKPSMPLWLGNIIASFLAFIGPRGVDFARYSIDYHILRNYLHVLSYFGEEYALRSLPQYAWDIVNHYENTYDAFRILSDQVKAKSTRKKR